MHKVSSALRVARYIFRTPGLCRFSKGKGEDEQDEMPADEAATAAAAGTGNLGKCVEIQNYHGLVTCFRCPSLPVAEDLHPQSMETSRRLVMLPSTISARHIRLVLRVERT